MCCSICGKPIPAGRLEALPNTTTCVEHSSVTTIRNADNVNIAQPDPGDINRSVSEIV